MDKWTAPKDSILRDYDFNSSPPNDDRRNTLMAKYYTPQLFDAKTNHREAVALEGDFRDGFVHREGQVLPKPSRCSIYSAFGEEGKGGEESEIADATPPPSPVAEALEEDEEVAGEYEYQPPTLSAPLPWYENSHGDCIPAPLRPWK